MKLAPRPRNQQTSKRTKEERQKDYRLGLSRHLNSAHFQHFQMTLQVSYLFSDIAFD